jgi:hypothetical protein
MAEVSWNQSVVADPEAIADPAPMQHPVAERAMIWLTERLLRRSVLKQLKPAE